MKLFNAISTAAIIGMSFFSQSAGYAQTQIKQLKVGQSFGYDYAFCGYDSSVKDVQNLLNQGWQIQSSSSSSYGVRGMTGTNLDGQTIPCAATNYVLIKN